jgi:hypothetical protein
MRAGEDVHSRVDRRSVMAPGEAGMISVLARWERLLIAAVRFDDVLPDHEARAAEYVKVEASIQAPAEPRRSVSPCRSDDGTTYQAYLPMGEAESPH